MKKIITAIVFTVFIMHTGIYAGPNNGPVLKASYAPFGAGTYLAPHDKAINGGNDGLTSGSRTIDQKAFNAISGYSISFGYFYDWFQGDVSYTGIKTANQYVSKVSSIENKYYADASFMNVDVRGGYRFSKPGDTSYQWLYLGIRKSNLEIEYNNTEIDATGFIAGLYGFNSFGFRSPFEFVFTYDIYAGSYRYDNNHFNSDVDIKLRRKLSLDLGLSLGAGIQYEPWDLAVIFKVSPFLSEKNYKGENGGTDKSTNAAIMGAMIGIEVILSIPEYRNNTLE